MCTLRSLISFISGQIPTDRRWLTRGFYWNSCKTTSGLHGERNDQLERCVKGRVARWCPVCLIDTPYAFPILCHSHCSVSICLHLPCYLGFSTNSSPGFPLIFPHAATTPDWFHSHPQQPSKLASPSSPVSLWSLPSPPGPGETHTPLPPQGMHVEHLSRSISAMCLPIYLCRGLWKDQTGSYWSLDSQLLTINKCLLNERMV